MRRLRRLLILRWLVGRNDRVGYAADCVKIRNNATTTIASVSDTEIG